MDTGDFLTLRVGQPNDYARVNEYGELRFSGKGQTWDDLRVPLTQTKQGATAKPDFDQTNVGFLFPQNDATEILYGITQLPHLYAEGTTIYPHVHWQQAADQTPVFKLDYKWFNPDAAVPADFTTFEMSDKVFTYTSGNLHQISRNTSGITGTGMNISSLIIFKLYRQDNAYTGDVLTWHMDIHYAKDALGSEGQYQKI